MHLLVLADEELKEEFLQKKVINDCKITAITKVPEAKKIDADAIFILNEIDFTELSDITSTPVFINSTIITLKDLNLPENFTRFTGWPTLLQRETLEIATNNVRNTDILKKLQWNYITVADEPGFVSARTIAMIINEAYYALGDNVSTKDEIDLAMKLGTNYPYGPFEWSVKIGLQNISSLLIKLSKKDNRYIVAPLIESELKEMGV